MKGTIVYYGGFSLPDKNAAANRVVSNGKLFDSLGYNTVFLGADYENHFEGIEQLSDNMFEEAHPTSSIEWLKSIFSIENLKKVVSKYENVKMVILYNVPFITLCIAKKYFSENGIEVAYDCTEWTKYTEGSFLKRLFKYVDEFFVSNFAHKLADKMIVISNMMECVYKSNSKILKLPPLVDIKDPIWHQKAEKKDCFTFCFAGFPGGNKESLDKVVEAFKGIEKSKSHLKIVGITEREFSNMYPHIELADNISFLGKQTHKDTVKHILGCDCYIFIRPSDRRNNAGFPTKFVESFTCGVPIITTNVSDIKEYIKASENSVLLDNCEIPNIQEAMEAVLLKAESKPENVLKTNFYYEEYKTKTKKWFE